MNIKKNSKNRHYNLLNLFKQEYCINKMSPGLSKRIQELQNILKLKTNHDYKRSNGIYEVAIKNCKKLQISEAFKNKLESIWFVKAQFIENGGSVEDFIWYIKLL